MAPPDRDLSNGEGERRESAMRRKRLAVLGTLFVFGLGTGFYVGFRQAGVDFHGDAGFWSPAVSLGLILMFVVAIAAGTWIMNGVMDELERARSYKAAALGATLFLLAYPIWFFLWKGGFVREPIHWLLYAFFVFAMLGALVWYRVRES